MDVFYFILFWFSSMTDSSCALRIINVTDIYKLDNFASLKTLIKEKKNEMIEKYPNSKTVSILTGDFLAPYLLSSVDKGIGMMKMLNETPIDYVIFGNHEDDLEHEYTCQRIKEFKGTWINTNMQDHEVFDHQTPYEIITITNEDDSQTVKIGLIGVLSDSPSLYRKGCFGGATIKDPYDTMEEYKEKLEKEEGVNIVIPLCHLYVPQDKITCERFDFPVVLSGHDHHTVDEVFNGTRLLKAGSDGDKAVILDLVFKKDSKTPNISAEHVTVADWTPDAELEKAAKDAMSVLEKLENTTIATISDEYRPLHSVDPRGQDVTIAHFLFKIFKDALNAGLDEDRVDAVLISGGNVRGGIQYPDSKENFSLKNLKDEIQAELEAVIVPMSGQLIIDGIKSTRDAGSGPGYMQFDGGVTLDDDGNAITINGNPLDKEKTYNVATTLWDIQDGPSKPWTDYFKEHTDLLPDTEFLVAASILSYLAKNVWIEVYKSLDTNNDGIISEEELAAIDTDGDGRISKPEFLARMKELGWKVDENEFGFVDYIFQVAGDANSDGYLDRDEINNSPSIVKLY